MVEYGAYIYLICIPAEKIFTNLLAFQDNFSCRSPLQNVKHCKTESEGKNRHPTMTFIVIQLSRLGRLQLWWDKLALLVSQ